jgi:hypothetical protein
MVLKTCFIMILYEITPFTLCIIYNFWLTKQVLSYIHRKQSFQNGLIIHSSNLKVKRQYHRHNFNFCWPEIMFSESVSVRSVASQHYLKILKSGIRRSQTSHIFVVLIQKTQKKHLIVSSLCRNLTDT